MRKIKFIVSVIAVAAIAALIVGCGAKPLPADKSAKVVSKLTFDSKGGVDSPQASMTNIIADLRAKAISRASIDSSSSTSGTVNNPSGGSATYTCTTTMSIDTSTFDITGSMVMAFTYQDWYVEDDGEEYTVNGTLNISCPLDFDIGDLDTESNSIAYSISFTQKGDLEITNGATVTEASVDLKSDYSYSCTMDQTNNSAAVTVTCHTTGTVNDAAVDENFSFSATVELPEA